MSRSDVRRAIAVVAAVSLVCALPLAAPALAAKPKKGARFAGRTSAPPVEGFRAPVRFTVSPDGRSLYNFTFGTFGCFGAGGFRPGVNPYTGNSLIDAGRVKVAAGGRFSDKTLSAYSVAGQTTTTTISISGMFGAPKTATGTITFSQVVTGTSKSACGPSKLSFYASA